MQQAPQDGENGGLSLRGAIWEEPGDVNLPSLAHGKDPARLVY